MSERSETPLTRERTLATAAGLAAAGVLAQITYPLTSGDAAVAVTVLSVLLLAGAALVHSFAISRSVWPPVAVLLSAAGCGWLAEVAGVHTGFPFGEYRYTSLLGPSVLGVPVLVPLAWTMLAYPCLLAGRRLAGPSRRSLVAVLGGLALASWDLFLDPQLVALGGWEWRFPSPALPGVPGVPLTNYAGWAGVSIVMIAVMDRAVDAAERWAGAEPHGPHPRRRSPSQEAVPAAVLAWTWLGSTTGNLVFFGRPAVALYGGVAMGLFVVPYLRRLHQARRESAETSGE